MENCLSGMFPVTWRGKYRFSKAEEERYRERKLTHVWEISDKFFTDLGAHMQCRQSWRSRILRGLFSK